MLVYSCPWCFNEFDDSLLKWQYRRFKKQKCPFCGWEAKDKMPANWWAKKVDRI